MWPGSWDGVRNYQARNFMRDDMRKGDVGFFYHSNCAEPGIVGVVKVTREAYPDRFQFDPKSKYFDPKATPDAPRWVNVEVTYVRHLPRIVTLAELKEHPGLRDMKVIARGSRLSITPV
ncbi:MAG: EVE domain-containing protein, partial [Nitrospinae bacterium]|nr:EVE domain-containing protein [Nitrospinota bacterium]